MLEKLYEVPGQSQSLTDLKFGKSINNTNFDMHCGAMGTIERILSQMPAPKTKKKKKKKAKASAEDGDNPPEGEPGSPEGGAAKKKKKKKKAKKSNLPEPAKIIYGAPQTCEQAMDNTTSWR